MDTSKETAPGKHPFGYKTLSILYCVLSTSTNRSTAGSCFCNLLCIVYCINAELLILHPSSGVIAGSGLAYWYLDYGFLKTGRSPYFPF